MCLLKIFIWMTRSFSKLVGVVANDQSASQTRHLVPRRRRCSDRRVTWRRLSGQFIHRRGNGERRLRLARLRHPARPFNVHLHVQVHVDVDSVAVAATCPHPAHLTLDKLQTNTNAHQWIPRQVQTSNSYDSTCAHIHFNLWLLIQSIPFRESASWNFYFLFLKDHKIKIYGKLSLI